MSHVKCLMVHLSSQKWVALIIMGFFFFLLTIVRKHTTETCLIKKKKVLRIFKHKKLSGKGMIQKHLLSACYVPEAH